MKISSLAKYAVGVTMAGAMLAACSSGGNSSFGPTTGPAPMGHESGVTQLSVQRIAALTMPHYQARPVHPDHGKSWMLDSAKKKQLLYVADWSTNDVYVYDYPSGSSVGTLTGFDEPYGMCVDKKGDVYMTNFGNGSVDEYKPGGTSPIKTWSTNGYAIGCSVDKAGDLAVTDFYTSTGAGQVEVFAGGGTKGTSFSDSSACYYEWTAGYDNKGDLLLVGEYSRIEVCEVPSGGKSMQADSFNGTDDFPGGTMWDGKYIALGDQEANGTYETSLLQSTVSGSSVTLVNAVVLTDSCYGNYVDVVDPFVVGKKPTPINKKEGKVVVGGNLWCTDAGAGKVDFWAYPGGGSPSGSLSSSPYEPYGQAVTK